MKYLSHSASQLGNWSYFTPVHCETKQLILCYAEGMVQEMPCTNFFGILPALYYMLRLEYVYEREIRRCANPKCGEYFVPASKNRTYCSDLCSGGAESRTFSPLTNSKRSSWGFRSASVSWSCWLESLAFAAES